MPLAHTKINWLAVAAPSLHLWIRGNWLAECLADFCCSDIMPMKGEQTALIAAGDTKFCLFKGILNTAVQCTSTFVCCFFLNLSLQVTKIILLLY